MPRERVKMSLFEASPDVITTCTINRASRDATHPERPVLRSPEVVQAVAVLEGPLVTRVICLVHGARITTERRVTVRTFGSPREHMKNLHRLELGTGQLHERVNSER